ncbi:MAG: hypothetical protein D4S02_01555 [Rhodocyclaceae bacterium]|nr:MAG: hypothetical protein D4S02_01555 [Rhodocyclaceae bacterium]
MVIIMNSESGRHIEDEFGAFEEEVLNAQWLPQPLQVQPGLQKATTGSISRTATGMDADAFLRNIYVNQE